MLADAVLTLADAVLILADAGEMEADGGRCWQMLADADAVQELAFCSKLTSM